MDVLWTFSEQKNRNKRNTSQRLTSKEERARVAEIEFNRRLERGPLQRDGLFDQRVKEGVVVSVQQRERDGGAAGVARRARRVHAQEHVGGVRARAAVARRDLHALVPVPSHGSPGQPPVPAPVVYYVARLVPALGLDVALPLKGGGLVKCD